MSPEEKKLRDERDEVYRKWQHSITHGDAVEKDELRSKLDALNRQLNPFATVSAPPPAAAPTPQINPAKPTIENPMKHTKTHAEVGARMRQAREAAGFTSRQFVAATGVPLGTIGGAEPGFSLGERYRAALVSYLFVNRQWLETGEGEMFRQPPPAPPVLRGSARVPRVVAGVPPASGKAAVPHPRNLPRVKATGRPIVQEQEQEPLLIRETPGSLVDAADFLAHAARDLEKARATFVEAKTTLEKFLVHA